MEWTQILRQFVVAEALKRLPRDQRSVSITGTGHAIEAGAVPVV